MKGIKGQRFWGETEFYINTLNMDNVVIYAWLEIPTL